MKKQIPNIIKSTIPLFFLLVAGCNTAPIETPPPALVSSNPSSPGEAVDQEGEPTLSQVEPVAQDNVLKGTQTISKPGGGPFDSIGERTCLGYDFITSHHQRKFFIGKIYEFNWSKGDDRRKAREDALMAYVQANGLAATYQLEKAYSSIAYYNINAANQERIWQIETNRKAGYEIIEIDYVWK